MDKETSKAIKVLNNQKSKLDSGLYLNDQIWRTQLLSYIASYFSESSTEYKFLSKKFFHVDEYNSYGKISESIRQQDLKEKIKQAKSFIDNCIETLTNNGVYKKPKTNFLSRISEGWLIFICSLILSIIGGAFYIGYWYGQHSLSTSTFQPNQKSKDSTNYINDSTYHK